MKWPLSRGISNNAACRSQRARLCSVFAVLRLVSTFCFVLSAVCLGVLPILWSSDAEGDNRICMLKLWTLGSIDIYHHCHYEKHLQQLRQQQ
jgi:hypothetical protein